MRLASFNVENLFDRAKIMNKDNWNEGREVLTLFNKLLNLLEKQTYSNADKARMVELLKQLGLAKSDTSEYVLLRQNKGRLLKRPRGGGLEIVAGGRADWIGSLELVDEPIDERATRNTAQVIRDVGADVLGVVEAEGRIQLKEFNDFLLPAIEGEPYQHIMLIDGNDNRGIDVGLLTRQNFSIGPMFSHIDDLDDDGKEIFSRDCPEYCVVTPSGAKLWVLVNHLKSKGYGNQADNDRKRLAQAKAIRRIYEALLSRNEKHVAVIGDLNDTPDSTPLQPLVAAGLKDVSELAVYEDDGHPGTYKNGTKSQKIDYILLSPALAQKATKAAVFRKGVWGGTHGDRWEIYPEMEKEEHAASDHAAIWCDLDI